MSQFDPAVIYAMYGFDPTRSVTGPEYSTRMPVYGDLSTISTGEFGRQMDQQLLALRQSQAAIRQIQAQQASTAAQGTGPQGSGQASKSTTQGPTADQALTGFGAPGVPGKALPRGYGSAQPDFSAVKPAVISATPRLGNLLIPPLAGAVNSGGFDKKNSLFNRKRGSWWEQNSGSPVVEMFKGSVSGKQGVYGG